MRLTQARTMFKLIFFLFQMSSITEKTTGSLETKTRLHCSAFEVKSIFSLVFYFFFQTSPGSEVHSEAQIPPKDLRARAKISKLLDKAGQGSMC